MSLAMNAEELESFLAREFPQVVDDFRVESLSAAALTMRMAIREAHLRPGGTVSGPSMFALADVAIYLAVLSRIGPVALAVTTNCSIDFMRKPAAGCDLLAEARLLKLGRQLAVGDVLIFSEGQPEPVARAGMTYAIPPAR
ncbi:PaaI family thioesterase [Tropicimonas aquimaris]|uniref:PaaI family thioesterase n=1 Tax=Tropicimonas aquimaris TaxID=914152 RepID=A0ABW3IU59_9RHOB